MKNEIHVDWNKLITLAEILNRINKNSIFYYPKTCQSGFVFKKNILAQIQMCQDMEINKLVMEANFGSK